MVIFALTEYPTVDQIIRLNRETLEQIKVKKADSHKVLSTDQISTAISACKEDPGDIYDKAATLLVSIVRGHPFDSGNRRTAVVVAVIFLRANGESPNLTHDERILMGIREGFYAKSEIKN